MWNKLCLLILGGGLGTVCRFFMAQWVQERLGAHFPYGTLLVNMLGCGLIGFLFALLENEFSSLSGSPYALRVLLISGLLGGFTTFSSYEMESFILLRQGAWDRALLYILGSAALGLLMVAGAFVTTRFCLSGRV